MVTIDLKSETTETQLPPSSEGLPPAYTPPSYAETTPAESSAGDSVGLPPSFSDGPSTSTASSIPRPPLVPPSNFLTIERGNNSIKGTYSIDPTLSAPPGVVRPVGNDNRDLHLLLKTTNSSIKSVVDVVKSVDAKGPARLQAQTTNGSITLTIHDPQQNRFNLRAITTNSSINIYIPRKFTGPVTTRTTHGSVTFAPSVQEQLRTFSEVASEAKYFIGDYVSTGYENEETWLMDQLFVQTTNSSIRIYYADDESDQASDDPKGKGKEARSFESFIEKKAGGFERFMNNLFG